MIGNKERAVLAGVAAALFACGLFGTASLAGYYHFDVDERVKEPGVFGFMMVLASASLGAGVGFFVGWLANLFEDWLDDRYRQRARRQSIEDSDRQTVCEKCKRPKTEWSATGETYDRG